MDPKDFCCQQGYTMLGMADDLVTVRCANCGKTKDVPEAVFFGDVPGLDDSDGPVN
jgi:hypothetical protein